ncbi:hypothetical protein VKT23_000252 [Stygiomarasmius scandens]|uniref:Transmembrane protein n=1 Tax=Marasmiellus scandens TaxID=2682957 RepID=A0ABR1K6Z2_9AGAR
MNTDGDTVWKMVDDTDNRIEYTGDWKPSFGDDIIDRVGVSLNDSGSSITGPVFNNTVHSILTAGTSLKFRFNGTMHAALYGSNVMAPDLNGSFVMECLLDGVSVGTAGDGKTNQPITLSLPQKNIAVRNNQVLCRAGQANSDNVELGEHELVLNVINSTGTTAGLFVDYIVYETLPGASVDGEILQMGNGDVDFPANRDQHLSFSPGWVENLSFANICTDTPGSFVTVKFNGTGIQFYGELVAKNLASNRMIYQLDDQDPEEFQLLTPGDGHNRKHQMLFEAQSLSPGEHTVAVTHNGTAPGMPLIVDYFLVTSLTSEEQALISSTPSDVPSGPSSTDSPNHQQRVAVIGGAIGGSLLFSLIVAGAALFLWMRNRRRQKEKVAGIPHPYVESSGADFNPYNLESSSHVRTKESMMESSRFHRSSSRPAPAEDIDVVRTRNLKLQQRLIVLQAPVSENRQAEQLPITHTDSGWRMREGGNPERPPGYTEA